MTKKMPLNIHADKIDAEEPNPQPRFTVVGIGASAGGLEALELFFSQMPADSGMAFVIIQHLDPTHKGMMAELLQRATSMPVVQATDQMPVTPNCVYVIPPNVDMSILHGVLYLLEPLAPRGLRLPIDFFFRSLAEDQQESSIGVILSGMGSDGMLGARAIKEKAGAVFVQEPATAKFDSMPRSTVEAGLADVVAPVGALPGRIRDYLQHLPLVPHASLADLATNQGALEKVVILLRTQTGHDFSLYKKTTIYRRIERRMGLHQIDKIASYVRFLRENPQELELLFRELLIGVTSFFRDPEAWEQLKTEILPALLAECEANQTLRAWVPACSTGEEAYSLAIVFREVIAELQPAKNIRLQIFATDLDRDAIAKARTGLFPANIAADVSARRLDRFFIQVEQGYQVAKGIREMVIFAPQNIIMDPPFTRLSLVSCRNLLIYLTPELQKKLLPLFHYSLNPGGFLLLGSSESVGNFTSLFAPLNGKNRLYRRLDSIVRAFSLEFPTAFVTAQVDAPTHTEKPVTDLQSLIDQKLLREYAPAAALTNEKGDILYISGRTGKYLEPAAGKANWNIFAMARDGLRYELANGFQLVIQQKETIALKNIVVGTEGGRQVVNVTIEPLLGDLALEGLVLIVFYDVVALPKTRTRAPGKPGSETLRTIEMEQELGRARQELQRLREEMQTSQEELKSTNEELQSTNEELQSTNEELTTSKEELQSINEELHTVNQELQTRLDELSRTNNDMKNLLDSTDIATLFLDNALCVRRFNSETARVTRLIPGDVGRLITDIASALLYPELAENAREVLRTLIKVEKQVQTPDGKWFAVRILPYRTLENMIDGVVITFTDISAFKTLELELRAKRGTQ